MAEKRNIFLSGGEGGDTAQDARTIPRHENALTMRVCLKNCGISIHVTQLLLTCHSAFQIVIFISNVLLFDYILRRNAQKHYLQFQIISVTKFSL